MHKPARPSEWVLWESDWWLIIVTSDGVVYLIFRRSGQRQQISLTADVVACLEADEHIKVCADADMTVAARC